MNHDASPAEVAAPGVTGWPLRLRRAGVFLLESTIVLYLLSLAILLVTGGSALGPLSIRRPAKPVLALLLLVPLRLTLDDPSWILRHLRRALPGALRQYLALRRIRWPPAMVDVLFALGVSQVVTLGVAFVANVLFSASRPRTLALPFRRAKLAEIFAAWDSGWYFDIAARGYYFAADGQSSVAFFPLYPLLMRTVGTVLGGGDRALWMSGVIVSCTSFAFALFALHRFAERTLGNREAARRTVLYVSLFPFSIFFTRVYAEALLLLTTVLAVSNASRGGWPRAGAWGALATLARPNGILIAIPLILIALQQPRGLVQVVTRLAWLLPVPLALAGYSAFVYHLSGDPLAWLAAQVHWGYSLGHAPWQQLLKMISRLLRYGLYDYFFVSRMAPYRLFHGVTALVFLALTPAVFKHLGPAMGLYVLVSLLVPLSSNALEGVGRYSAVLFPVFMLVGSVRSHRVHEFVLVASALVLALFLGLFVTLHPIY